MRESMQGVLSTVRREETQADNETFSMGVHAIIRRTDVKPATLHTELLRDESAILQNLACRN